MDNLSVTEYDTVVYEKSNDLNQIILPTPIVSLMVKNQITHQLKIKEKLVIDNNQQTLKPLLTVKDLDDCI